MVSLKGAEGHFRPFLFGESHGINGAMADLSTFSTDERVLLVSLSFRVGVWVSRAEENTRSRLDDVRERQALELVINRMAKAHRKKPFAAAIMQHVEKSQPHWETWEMQATEEQVLADLQKALQIGREKLPQEHIAQYKQAVWHVALAVAQAYGEQIDPDNEMHVDRFFSWVGSFIRAPSLQKAPENMSMAEKTALKKLRAVLKE